MRLSVTKNLGALKAQAALEMSRRANLWRAKHVTPNKDAIYQTKLAEGLRWLADGSPEDLDDYPWIKAEVGLSRTDAADLVDLWVELNTLWMTVIGPAIETAEQGAKMYLRQATTPAEIQEAVDRLPAS